MRLSRTTIDAWARNCSDCPGLRSFRARATGARKDYAKALERPAALSPAQRASILDTLKSFTGVDSSYVDPKTLALFLRGCIRRTLAAGSCTRALRRRMVGPACA